jgi:hypothetical protein
LSGATVAPRPPAGAVEDLVTPFTAWAWVRGGLVLWDGEGLGEGLGLGLGEGEAATSVGDELDPKA